VVVILSILLLCLDFFGKLIALVLWRGAAVE
jgi:hypothetical protein